MRVKWVLILISLTLFSSTCLAENPAQAREGMFSNSGLTIHYTIQGRGDPIVLISGGPGQVATYMKPLATMLSANHTAILIEQRGTGRSIPVVINSASISNDLLIADLEALRVALGFKRWTLLGHSFGTFTAMRYATYHPAQTQALILLATSPPRSIDDHFFDNVSSRMPPLAQARLAEITQLKKSANAEQLKKLSLEEKSIGVAPFFFDVKNAESLLVLPDDPPSRNEVFLLLWKDYQHFDLVDTFKVLHIPTLIVQGRQDPLDLEMAGRTRDAIPGAKLVILERCGHFAWLEQPDRLRQTLLTFLSSF